MAGLPPLGLPTERVAHRHPSSLPAPRMLLWAWHRPRAAARSHGRKRYAGMWHPAVPGVLPVIRQTVDVTSGGINGVQEERQVLIFRPRAQRRTTSCHSHSSWRGLGRQGEEIRESPLTLFADGGSRCCSGELLKFNSRSHRFEELFAGISIGPLDFSHDGAWVAYVTLPERVLCVAGRMGPSAFNSPIRGCKLNRPGGRPTEAQLPSLAELQVRPGGSRPFPPRGELRRS